MTKIIQLRNGELVTIRSITQNDASNRHSFFVNLSLADEGMVNTVDEIDYHTQESEEKISQFLRKKNGLWLVAEADGKIIGEVDIFFEKLSRICHNGKLTIGVLPDWQGHGLASHLMNEALIWAKNSGILRIEISVFENNTKARKLYEKHGFVIEGTRRGFLRRDSDFEDDILMAVYV